MEENSKHNRDELSTSKEAERAYRKEKHKEYYRRKRKSKRNRKKIKRILEIIGWTVIIVAFILTIVILMKELDIIGMGKKNR